MIKEIMYIKWLGTAGIEINIDNKTILIDPYLSRISLFQFLFMNVHPDKKIIKEKIKTCDYIFITHAHFDHIMDTSEIMKNTSCTTYGSYNSCEIIKKFGIEENKLIQINYKDIIKINDIKVEVYKSNHLELPGMYPKKITENYKKPQKAKDYYMDSSFSFLFTFKNINIKLFLCNNKILDDIPECDILITTPFHTQEYFEKIIKKTKSKTVIPNHWDNYFISLDKKIVENFTVIYHKFPYLKKINLNNFAKMIKNISPDVDVFKLEIFKEYEINNLLEKTNIEKN